MEKSKSIQALRAIAFLGIFLAHAGSVISWPNLSVSVFFMLSGYLLTGNYIDKAPEVTFKSCFTFSYKRIKKLYPIHLITMFLAAALIIAKALKHGDLSGEIPGLIRNVILNIFLVQSWWPDVNVGIALNGVAWFLSAAAFLYFIFPVMLKFLKNSGKTVLAVTGVIFIALQVGSCFLVYRLGSLYRPDEFMNIYNWFCYIFPLFRVGDFFFGGLLYIFTAKHKENNNVAAAGIIEFIVIAAVIAISVLLKAESRFNNAPFWNGTTIYMLMAIGLVFIFAENKGIFTKILTNPVTVWIGDLTPVAFLIHFVVTQYVGNAIYFFDFNLSRIAWIFIYVFEFIISLLISKLLYLIMKKIPRKSN